MSFNLGRPRFKKFVKMIKAVQDGDFDEAAVQILDSDAARNPLTKTRYENLAADMRDPTAADADDYEDAPELVPIGSLTDAEHGEALYKALTEAEAAIARVKSLLEK